MGRRGWGDRAASRALAEAKLQATSFSKLQITCRLLLASLLLSHLLSRRTPGPLSLASDTRRSYGRRRTKATRAESDPPAAKRRYCCQPHGGRPARPTLPLEFMSLPTAPGSNRQLVRPSRMLRTHSSDSSPCRFSRPTLCATRWEICNSGVALLSRLRDNTVVRSICVQACRTRGPATLPRTTCAKGSQMDPQLPFTCSPPRKSTFLGGRCFVATFQATLLTSFKHIQTPMRLRPEMTKLKLITSSRAT